MPLKDRIIFQESVMHSFSHDFRAPIRRIRVRVAKLKDYITEELDVRDKETRRVSKETLARLSTLEKEIISIGDSLRIARTKFNDAESFDEILFDLRTRTQPRMKKVVDDASNLKVHCALLRSDRANSFAEEIYDNASRINRMTLAIFEFVSAGERNRPRHPINLTKEFSRTIDDIDDFPSASEIFIETFGSVTGRFEQFKLALIYQNILTNSIKYRSLKRPCRIAMTAKIVEKFDLVRSHDLKAHFSEDEKLSEYYAYLLFEDNGVGIPENILPFVFDLFTREEEIADRQRSDTEVREAEYETVGLAIESSTGVGLSIVRQLVLSMHGKIWVTSTVNVGTNVHILLPYEE